MHSDLNGKFLFQGVFVLRKFLQRNLEIPKGILEHIIEFSS